MSAIAVRLGWCPRDRGQAREIAESPRTRTSTSAPPTPADSSPAPSSPDSVRWAVLYATSRPVRRWTYDVEAAKRLIGYEPRDAWPQGAEELLAG